MRRWWQRRWTVDLVGQETGRRYKISFMEFRTRPKALEWATRMNASIPDGLTRWEVRNLKEGKGKRWLCESWSRSKRT